MPKQELVVQEQALTPVELLRIAVTQGADVEKLEKLMALQERWEAGIAKKAYIEAMNQFKASPVIINKTKSVTISKDANAKPAYWYAPLDEVCDKVIPALNAVGITHSWSMTYEGEWMVVRCTLTHEMGHSDSTSMRGVADKTGAKNAIQAEGSTLTYLQRYTLCAVCGIAIRNMDNDGASAPRMPEGWLDERCEWLENACNQEELKKLFKDAYGEASKVKDRKALEVLIAAKDHRKAEL
jgi:hypothetical protein